MADSQTKNQRKKIFFQNTFFSDAIIDSKSSIEIVPSDDPTEVCLFSFQASNKFFLRNQARQKKSAVVKEKDPKPMESVAKVPKFVSASKLIQPLQAVSDDALLEYILEYEQKHEMNQ